MGRKSKRRVKSLEKNNRQGSGKVELWAEPTPFRRYRQFCESQGSSEWWWIQDEALEMFAAQLAEKNFVCFDSFLPSHESRALQADLQALNKHGNVFQTGYLAGNSVGGGLAYAHDQVRGDHVCWVNGDEANYWSPIDNRRIPNGNTMSVYLKKMDTFISELSRQPQLSGELQGVKDRSHAMTTIYPGDGAGYVRHCDNHCSKGGGDSCNGRRVTAIMYLNEDWSEEDGGELLLYSPPPLHDSPLLRIPPKLGTVIVFFSDYRVPHSVLPANNERFAVTTWYYDTEERNLAIERGTASTDEQDRAHTEKVHREVREFEKRTGKKARECILRVPSEPGLKMAEDSSPILPPKCSPEIRQRVRFDLSRNRYMTVSSTTQRVEAVYQVKDTPFSLIRLETGLTEFAIPSWT